MDFSAHRRAARSQIDAITAVCPAKVSPLEELFFDGSDNLSLSLVADGLEIPRSDKVGLPVRLQTWDVMWLKINRVFDRHLKNSSYYKVFFSLAMTLTLAIETQQSSFGNGQPRPSYRAIYLRSARPIP